MPMEEKRHGITKKATVPKVTLVKEAEAIKTMSVAILGNMKTRQPKLVKRTIPKTLTQILWKA